MSEKESEQHSGMTKTRAAQTARNAFRRASETAGSARQLATRAQRRYLLTQAQFEQWRWDNTPLGESTSPSESGADIGPMD